MFVDGDWPKWRSAGTGKAVRFGVNGDGAAEGGALVGLAGGPVPIEISPVSSLVIARPLGTLLEPLAFRFFEDGPDCAVGEAWRDKLRGVMVADVVVEGCIDGPALIGAENCCRLKSRCKPCKSELECDTRNGVMFPTGPAERSKAAPFPENGPATPYI